MIVTDKELAELRYLAHAAWRADREQQREQKRQAGCIGKHPFETKGEAKRSIRGRLGGCNVHAYRCKDCGKWHVGSGDRARFFRLRKRRLCDGV